MTLRLLALLSKMASAVSRPGVRRIGGGALEASTGNTSTVSCEFAIQWSRVRKKNVNIG